MDKNIARELAVAAIKSSSVLTNLLPSLKDRCRPGEYEEMRKSISGIAADISIEVLHRIFKEHPDLERELDEAIRSGRPLA